MIQCILTARKQRMPTFLLHEILPRITQGITILDNPGASALRPWFKQNRSLLNVYIQSYKAIQSETNRLILPGLRTISPNFSARYFKNLIFCNGIYNTMETSNPLVLSWVRLPFAFGYAPDHSIRCNVCSDARKNFLVTVFSPFPARAKSKQLLCSLLLDNVCSKQKQ